jgi:hypothetical protein
MEIKMVLYLPRDSASVPVSRRVLDGCLQTLGSHRLPGAAGRYLFSADGGS